MSIKKQPAKKLVRKQAKKKVAKKKVAKKKTGRPRIVIDGNQVEAMAQIGCTTDEIGSVVGCSRDTLERRFAAEIVKGRLGGKVRLRKIQMNVALSGNVTMLIWLGKQGLGQSDKLLNEHTGADGGPIDHQHGVTLNLTMNQNGDDPWEYDDDTEGAKSNDISGAV